MMVTGGEIQSSSIQVTRSSRGAAPRHNYYRSIPFREVGAVLGGAPNYSEYRCCQDPSEGEFIVGKHFDKIHGRASFV